MGEQNDIEKVEEANKKLRITTGYSTILISAGYPALIIEAFLAVGVFKASSISDSSVESLIVPESVAFAVGN